MIPDSIRINDQNRATIADSQTVGFGTKDTAWTVSAGFVKVEFFEAFFQIVPCFDSGFFAATNGFGLISTDENMSIDAIESQSLNAI